MTKKVFLTDKMVDKYTSGYPLIQKTALQSLKGIEVEGSILDLYSTSNHFVGRGYYGKQNKGVGWVLTYRRDEQIDETFFISRMEKAFKYRASFKEDSSTTAYRVFNGGEGDGVGGLTIDYLDGHYLMTYYSQGIYSFKEMILTALEKLTSYKSIYEKRRFDKNGTYNQGGEDFVKGHRPEFPIMVLENNVKFPVYLDDGPMIGFFLDQKDVRQSIRGGHYAKGKSVLNTFSYTGAFSVYAALGGASETTSVDLANRSLPKTKEIFECNHIDLGSHKIIVEDVFNYFKYAVRKKVAI